jgi:hypothetical protein
MFQRIGKLILIIDRGFSKTLIWINVLINHIGDICKMLIKDISDSLMICSASAITIY